MIKFISIIKSGSDCVRELFQVSGSIAMESIILMWCTHTTALNVFVGLDLVQKTQLKLF